MMVVAAFIMGCLVGAAGIVVIACCIVGATPRTGSPPVEGETDE